MKYLYRFYWDCGRMGDVEGLFVATQREVDSIVDTEIYLGEILGKHSEVYGTVKKEDIEKLDISSEAVEEVSKYLGEEWSGYNPLNYRETHCEECEESMQHDDWNVEFRKEFDMDMCYECYEEKI